MITRILDALFQNILSLLNKLSVQINRVVRDAAWRIVFTENELGGLLVVLLHLSAVRFAFLGKLFCACTVAVFVCLFGLYSHISFDKKRFAGIRVGMSTLSKQWLRWLAS